MYDRGIGDLVVAAQLKICFGLKIPDLDRVLISLVTICGGA